MSAIPASTSASHRGKLRGNPVWSGVSGATLAARESKFYLDRVATNTRRPDYSPAFNPTPASRPSGEWNNEVYAVLADGVVVGRIFKANAAPVGAPVFMDARLRPSQRPHADTRLRGDAREGRDGGIR
jgi:hypothetical protein